MSPVGIWPYCGSAPRRGPTLHRRASATALVALLAVGCQPAPSSWLSPAHPPDDPPPALPDADNPLMLTRGGQPAAAPAAAPPAPRVVYELAVLHVLAPREPAALDKVWNFLREDLLDSETRLRLSRNGLRVGVGHVRDWEAIRAALDSIEDHRVLNSAPLSVPVGFPLSLELDTQPRDQTLFCVEADGILSGSTWPASRNVIRVTYAPDPHDVQRILLLAVPEVHQQRDGWEWIRTEAGLWQVPRRSTETFSAAGFAVTLDPGEFVLIAPSEQARIAGLLGRAFLTRTIEGREYCSCVFLRPQARQVGQHE